MERRKKILVIDDDPDILTILEIRLSLAGFEAVTCESSKKAVEVCENDRFDLWMIDFGMPHMQGHTLLSVLRAISGNSDTPALIMTARGANSIKPNFDSLPNVDFADKPFFDFPRDVVAKINYLTGASPS